MQNYIEENPAADDTPEQVEVDDEKNDAFEEVNKQIIIPLQD